MRYSTYNRISHRYYKYGRAARPYAGEGIWDIFRRIGSTVMNFANTRLGNHIVQGVKNVGQRAVQNVAQNLGNLISNPKPTASSLLSTIGNDALRQTMSRVPQYLSGNGTSIPQAISKLPITGRGIKPNPIIVNRR